MPEKTAKIDPDLNIKIPCKRPDSSPINVDNAQNVPHNASSPANDFKLLDKSDENEVINDGLSTSIGRNLLEKSSPNPSKIGSNGLNNTGRFGDIIPKLRQTGLVRLPDLGMVVIQSEVSTSNGRQARKLVRRKRRKKEEESVNTSKMNIKNYFQKVEDNGNCRNGKRKNEQCPTEENKKLKVGNQTTV